MERTLFPNMRAMCDQLPDLVAKGRAPVFVRMQVSYGGRMRGLAVCAVPLEGAKSWGWSDGAIQFFSETGEHLGHGDGMWLNPRKAGQLQDRINQLTFTQ